ncbi:Peter Pan-like protein [Babesia sp. Xinjiang]|uniref:Peter Pan-like protein n=1 Tax=Babesia sp. Xinjiang TaxID=462227 RepID=UPI000A239E23|nr:Peter Pan-like protein [Babesia sp. Xinjiang]ORM41886.1 Peter Pan-like protein [Babesia sp. Xinjiang]
MGKSGRRRKRKTHAKAEIDADTPRIVVIRRGSLRPELKQLVQDLRILVSPNCASRLKEAGHQKMKDFTQVSDALGLTHLVAVSETDRGCYLKVANLPNGPTLTFSIDMMTLISDIAKHTSNPKSIGGACHNSPLVVLNGFGGHVESHKQGSSGDYASAMKTVSNTFNSLFSPIDVSTTKMQNCKRVVLFNKNRDTDVIVMRHYLINLVDCNTSTVVQELIDKRSAKRLIREKGASFKDVIRAATSASSSNLNDDYVELRNVDSRDVLLRNKYGITNTYDLEDACDSNHKLAVSLVDAGPRLNLRLIKIQEGVFSGGVLFHKFIHKTREDIDRLEATFAEKRRLEQESEERKRRKSEVSDSGEPDESAEE